jgi:hypothetical protein
MCVYSLQAVVEDVDGRTPIDVARDEARMILLKVCVCASVSVEIMWSSQRMLMLGVCVLVALCVTLVVVGQVESWLRTEASVLEAESRVLKVCLMRMLHGFWWV